MPKSGSQLRYWLGGIRLYIGVGIALLTGQLWWWAHQLYGGTTELLVARLHEAFGWVALILLATAMAIGPLYKLLPRLQGKALMRDARRMFGIGAAWFATLHASLAYFVSFQAANPLQLPSLYRQAFLLGALALLILLALAFTSFDAAFRGMGVWWFRLHRLVYVTAIIAVWHALGVGVHAAGMPAVAIIIGVGLLLFMTHLQVALSQQKPVTIWQIGTLCLVGLIVLILSNYGVQLYINQGRFHG